jgi:hypothetical protein
MGLVQFPVDVKYVSSLRSVQSIAGQHPASNAMDRDLFLAGGANVV